VLDNVSISTGSGSTGSGSTVPEPGTFPLLGAGLTALTGMTLRKLRA
jgi:hypothetical protein